MDNDNILIDGLEYVNWNRDLFEKAHAGGLTAIHATLPTIPVNICQYMPIPHIPATSCQYLVNEGVKISAESAFRRS